MLAQLPKITIISLFLIFSSFTARKTHYKGKATYVYICFTKGSYAYHYDYDCQGLKRCKGEKKKVTLTDAKGKYERKLCGYED